MMNCEKNRIHPQSSHHQCTNKASELLNETLRQKLLKDFPTLFCNQASPTSFGVKLDFGPGWYSIIYRAATALHIISIDFGTPLYIEALTSENGALVIDIDGADIVTAIAQAALFESKRTCQSCGVILRNADFVSQVRTTTEKEFK